MYFITKNKMLECMYYSHTPTLIIEPLFAIIYIFSRGIISLDMTSLEASACPGTKRRILCAQAYLV
jgi:hypothetical protein